MADWPCTNPNCNSVGSPHPNCGCPAPMAKGGKVSHYCKGGRAHKKGCQYFADGGEAIPDVAPAVDDESPEEAPEQAPKQEMPAFLSDEDMAKLEAEQAPAAKKEMPAFLSDEDMAKLEAEQSGAAPDNGMPAFLSDEDMAKLETEQYETPGQQVATIAEGAAQGLAGPLATLAETKLLGISAEDIKKRQEANPWEHGLSEAGALAGGLLTGTGEAALVGKAAEAAAQVAKLGKVGSAALKGFISNGLIQGGDEISKAILGGGDPEAATNPYMAIGTSALFGGLLGGAGAKLSQSAATGINKITDSKATEAAQKWLAGLGHAASGGELEEAADKAFSKGFNFFKKIPEKITEPAIRYAGYKMMQHDYSGEGALLSLASKYFEPIVAKVVNKTGKYVVPTVARWLSEGAEGSVFNMLDYADKVAKGNSAINNTIDALFKSGAQQAVNAATPKNIEKLKNFIDGGGVDQSIKQELQEQPGETQGFAEGGHVEAQKVPSLHDDHAHLAAALPEQNMILQTAKARISKHLSAMRPQEDVPRLAFDDKPDDREQKKKYGRALEVAASPLSVLHHASKGTLEPEHLEHLSAMYPELTGHLQKKVTERIIKAQMDGEKPSFKVRQGLSMFMGAPLSGEFTPQAIRAVQAVFIADTQKPQPQEGQASRPKKSTAPLSKSSRSYLTDDQAREERRQKT